MKIKHYRAADMRQALRLVLQEPGAQTRIRRVKGTVIIRDSTPALSD